MGTIRYSDNDGLAWSISKEVDGSHLQGAQGPDGELFCFYYFPGITGESQGATGGCTGTETYGQTGQEIRFIKSDDNGGSWAGTTGLDYGVLYTGSPTGGSTGGSIDVIPAEAKIGVDVDEMGRIIVSFWTTEDIEKFAYSDDQGTTWVIGDIA